MLRVMLRKIWHKKWLILCMLLGSMLLVATVVSFPMYKTAAFDRMLQDEFEQYLTDESEWPALNEMTIISKKDAGGKTIARMENLMREIYPQLGVEEQETVLFYCLAKAEAESEMKRQDLETLSLRIGYMSDMEEHIADAPGVAFSETGMTEDGCYEVLISEECMVTQNLLLGETIEFTALKDIAGEPIRLKIIGTFQKASDDDFYWQAGTESLQDVMLIKDDLFRNNFLGENAGKYTITCNYYSLFSYENLKTSQVAHLMETTKYYVEESPYRSTMSQPAYYTVLEEFCQKRDRIEATLLILQVPVLILLCAFLFMISGQMYEMERNEISVLKSRGGSGNQIFRLYFYQSIFLTLTGAVFGLPLGMFFCKMLGSAESFLEFNTRRVLNVSMGTETWVYAAAAMLASVLIMTLPAIKHSRVTIVKLKRSKAAGGRRLWEKCFLDIICLAISLYGYYNFSKNREMMIQDVLSGKALDPLLYISSSLFIVGLGLLFLRVQPLLIRIIFRCGKRFWKPASYASFLENLKNGRKQQFIMLFMILTISLGMFHATVARTILKNARDNTEYLDGADVIIKEVWGDNSAFASSDNATAFQYYEPDYNKYTSMSFAKSNTKVIYDEKAYVNASNNGRVNITLMGIHTKEFGENTQLDDSLLEKPYYTYLNELAVEEKGILVSRNFESILGYKIGDSVIFYNGDDGQVSGKIVDFVDYWPGYQPGATLTNQEGTVVGSNNYLLITHYALLRQQLGTIPYEVWITLKEDAEENSVPEWIAENDVKVTKYVNRQKDLDRIVEEPLMQGTNGILTMGFIVTILLCGVGYLIYWIMSIRSREMIFGVLRACGMHKGELFHMLMNEQVFSGLFSVVAGIVIGNVASEMFVPILQTAYAAANQVLPMQLVTDGSDMGRLYGVIFAVMVICLAVLIVLVFKMNVAKALKLGEE